MALTAYYVMLTIYLVASFFPEHRIWGVSVWGYVPQSITFAIIGVAALMPSAIRYLLRRLPSDQPDTGSNRFYFIITVTITAALAAAFIILRGRTHFLGDGFTVLGQMGTPDPLIKFREIGESIIHLWLRNILPGDGQAVSLLSFQVVSIGAGIIFLLVTALMSAKLFGRLFDRLLFWLILATGGYMLLFFGYVEYYSMFVATTGIYVLAGLLAIRNTRAKWIPLTLAVIVVTFHIMGVFLLPSVLFLLFYTGEFDRNLKRRGRKLRLLGTIIAGALLASVFAYQYATNLFFRFAFLSITESVVTVEGYTMFSAAHLLDFANLLIMLVPSLGLAIFIAPRLPWRKLLQAPEYRFLAIAVSSVLTAVLIFEPKLGMPRDWDLFSFAGMVVAISWTYVSIQNRSTIGLQRLIPALAVILGLVTLAPRVVTQMVPEKGVALFKHYRDLDKTKNRNGQAILVNYFRDIQDVENNRAEEQWRRAAYPEVSINDRAVKMVETGRGAEALPLARRMLKADPIFWNAWTCLGACYIATAQYDSAVWALETSLGLNPFEPKIRGHLGLAYFYNGQIDKAEASMLAGLEIDPSQWSTHLGLADLYLSQGNQKKAAHHFELLAMAEGAPVKFVKRAGDFFLKNKQFRKAASIYKVGLSKGLDSAYVRALLVKYPELGK